MSTHGLIQPVDDNIIYLNFYGEGKHFKHIVLVSRLNCDKNWFDFVNIHHHDPINLYNVQGNMQKSTQQSTFLLSVPEVNAVTL